MGTSRNRNVIDFTYGEARPVAERLMQEDDVQLTDVVSALINALRRIDHLERRVRLMENREAAIRAEAIKLRGSPS